MNYSQLHKQFMAIYFSGIYVSNFELKKIADAVGFEVDLSDRDKMFHTMIGLAKEQEKMPQFIGACVALIKGRIEGYIALSERFPDSKNVIHQWIHKANSTILLLQREVRVSAYE